jgi:hypothetical protein
MARRNTIELLFDCLRVTHINPCSLYGRGSRLNGWDHPGN